MHIDLYGGFGEKGRTCLGVSAGGYRMLLDAGVKTSARGTRDYYPALTQEKLAALDAIVITHAHEDHVAALGWCIARGFRGRILMTAETRREADASIAAYGSAEEHALAKVCMAEALPLGGDALRLGPFNVFTGRSGHMAGSVWLAVDDGRTRLAYCGDMVAASPVFATDPIPAADAIVFDASYGDDDTPFAARGAAIHAWLAAHPQGCVLPTPLYGRSAELCAIVDGPLALAPGMRAALATQRDGEAWLKPGIAAALSARLSAGLDWQPGAPLPRAALLCADGMGLSGPSQAILAAAARARHPTLFTGHLPEGSPGAAMARDGLADWIRLPTHPTLGENVALVASLKAKRAIGHSCDAAMLARLAAHIPALDATLATGDALDL
ncbi:MAG TPA: MBL fold metallo-hydrolase [Casimicrobiaceae bacterium]|jgi:hypothetical protein